LGGIILSGLGPSIWYGGDKIVALWVAFFGVVLLFLTGVVQIQAYIQATILQPNFEVASRQKSISFVGKSACARLEIAECWRGNRLIAAIGGQV
jgi:hypothetical protein